MNTQFLAAKVKKRLASEGSGHDFSHVARVVSNAEKILCAHPEADRDTVVPAALLHDVADHKLVAPEEQQQTLQTMRLWLEEAEATSRQVETVMHICTNLSFSCRDTNLPLPIEGLIVQDADRLDAIGAIGIARAFAFGGSRGREIYRKGSKDDTVSHFYEKLLQVKDLMNTRQGRRMARRRHKFLETFLSEFFREVEP